MRRLEALDEGRRYRIAERLTASPTKLRRGLASVMEQVNASFSSLRDAKKRVDGTAKMMDEMPASEMGGLTDSIKSIQDAFSDLQRQMVAFYTEVQEKRAEYKQGDEARGQLK